MFGIWSGKKQTNRKKDVKAVLVSFMGNKKDRYEDNYLLYPDEILSIHEQEQIMGRENWHQHVERNIQTNFAVYALSDGMGGQNHGEMASFFAIDHMKQSVQKIAKAREDETEELLKEFVQNCNKEIYEKAQAEVEWKGMGATLVMLILKNGYIYLVNVGDSRIYQWDEQQNQLLQISTDQTEGQRLLDLGLLVQNELKQCPQAECLTQYMGKMPEEGILQPQIIKQQLTGTKEKFFLCSDGLSKYILHSELEKIYGDDTEIKSFLIEKIIKEGLEKKKEIDNVTWIEIQIEECDKIRK